MGDASTALSESDARHLFRRTSFGGTTRRRDIDKAIGRPRAEVVDDLVDFRPNKFRPTGKNIRAVHDKWLKTMVKSRRQLQERMVLFWHDHFATSDDVVLDPKEMAMQNRTLRIHCIGAFLPRGARGSFRDLVKAINKDPAMMDMLDTRDNRKDAPNENYARELLELFTLGVFDSAGNPNYTETDIKQIARAFTGWRVTGKDETWFDGGTGDTQDGTRCGTTQTGRHDYSSCFPDRGAKAIFRSTGMFGPGGRDFAANGEGAPEVDTVIDIIFEHRDTDGHNTVARYVGRRLFEHFAYANPNIAVIDEIIAQSGFASHFLVQEFLRALFCHDEFYACSTPAGAATRKSVRWPADFVAGTLRLLQIKPTGRLGEMFIDGGSRRRLRDHLTDMGQTLFEPPTVFGWDLEDGWLSSATMLARFAFARDVTAARGRGSTSFRPEKLVNLGLTDPGDVVDAVADVLHIREQLDADERQALIDYLGDGPLNLYDFDYRNTKLNGLFALALQSPAYQLY